MTLIDDAQTAWVAVQQAAEEARKAERNQLAASARTKLSTVLAGANGTPRPLNGIKLLDFETTKAGVAIFVSLEGLVFALRTQLPEPEWTVTLVEDDAGGWTPVGDVASLAQLGRLISETSAP